MASYRTLTHGAVLDNGTKLGFGILDSANLNGRSLAKAKGCVRFKEVNANGEPLQGGKQASFGFGQTISGL